MSENKVNGLLNTTIEKVKSMVDVNTVVGEPIHTPEGATVIPISRISYGFGSGGSDLPSKSAPAQGLFAGGSGVGVTIVPIAFLVLHNGNVRILQIEPYMSPVDRALEKAPEMVDKLTDLLKKKQPEDDAIHVKGPDGEDIAITPAPEEA